MTFLERIRVLHVIDKLSMDGLNPSSPAILLRDWIPHFRTQGIESTVCCLRADDPGGKWLEAEGVQVVCLGFGKLSWKNVNGIISVIDQTQAQIVHLHGYSAANFGRIASRRKGIKNIVHEHAVLSVLPHQWIIDRLLMNYTDLGVAVSGNVSQFMVHGRSVPADKIRVVGNGINLSEFVMKSPDSILQTRRTLGIPENCSVIGTVTRLRKEKGTEFFIRAIPYVMQKQANVVFLVIGDGPLRSNLEHLATELGVADHVRFLGFRSEIGDMLSILDVNVIPSLTEGFPLSLIEGMAAGNAIVASNLEGLREIARDGETLLFVPPKDPKVLAEKIVWLLNDSSQASVLSEAAKNASLQFSIESSAAALGGLYRELLAA